MQAAISILRALAQFVRRRWRILAVASVVAAGLATAVMLADEQGRHDVRFGLPLHVSCEEDPEASLWRGGCERIAADIARTDRPSFVDLYSAFVALHHSPGPVEAAARRFAHAPVDAGFDVASALKGTRYVISTQHFTSARNVEHARAIMEEIDKKDRALLLVARGGLSLTALAAGTLANLTDALVLLGITGVACVLFFVARRRTAARH
jgi:hypothetical protein